MWQFSSHHFKGFKTHFRNGVLQQKTNGLSKVKKHFFFMNYNKQNKLTINNPNVLRSHFILENIKYCKHIISVEQVGQRVHCD